MKRILAVLLAVIMLIPGYSVFADSIEELFTSGGITTNRVDYLRYGV
mgnify:CR=1 FL=1